jgi:hypothetical protein
MLVVANVRVTIRFTKMTTDAMVVVTLMGEDNNVLECVVAAPHWFWMLCNC